MSLIDQIARHEGLRLKPYRCSAGKMTIGYGRNLEDTGITEPEARILLVNDIARAQQAIHSRLPWSLGLPQPAQDVLCNMAFNLGVDGLLQFKQFLAALQSRDYPTAADEMLNSQWATQVGSRATELARIIRGMT